MHYIQEIVAAQKSGKKIGIYSACTANSYALQAVMRKALETNTYALIEATANQVNQDGGYTGMTPKTFHSFVYELANQIGLTRSKIILGGDHLGPLTWSKLTEEEAMHRAETLIRCFVEAGFTKIHIDTSMRLGNDNPNVPLETHVIARRAARLCQVAETVYKEMQIQYPGSAAPVYVIGSEVPIPGGAQENESAMHITLPEDCLAATSAFQKAFAEKGLEDAWRRIVGIVVQPGVEFSDNQIFHYNRRAAANLTGILHQLPMVFEGHSTDYQSHLALREMVEDGIAVLKVGPALTFALREGFFALESIERELLSGSGVWLSNFSKTLEREMQEMPGQWEKHYHGNGEETRFMCRYSFSDRARYYLSNQIIRASVERLIRNLNSVSLPLSLISQYLPLQFRKCRAGQLQVKADLLLSDKVGDVIDDYLFATGTMLLA